MCLSSASLVVFKSMSPGLTLAVSVTVIELSLLLFLLHPPSQKKSEATLAVKVTRDARKPAENGAENAKRVKNQHEGGFIGARAMWFGKGGDTVGMGFREVEICRDKTEGTINSLGSCSLALPMYANHHRGIVSPMQCMCRSIHACDRGWMDVIMGATVCGCAGARERGGGGDGCVRVCSLYLCTPSLRCCFPSRQPCRCPSWLRE